MKGDLKCGTFATVWQFKCVCFQCVGVHQPKYEVNFSVTLS